MTEQMQQLLNADYPVPGPAWDYAEFGITSCTCNETSAHWCLLSQQEHASPEADQLIRKYLDQIGGSAIVGERRRCT